MLSEFPMCCLDRRLTPISYPRSCLLRCVILSNTLLWIHAGFEVLWAIFHAWVCHEFCAPMISDAQMSQLGSWPYGLNIRTHSWSNHPAWYVTHGSGESPHDHPTKKKGFPATFYGVSASSVRGAFQLVCACALMIRPCTRRVSSLWSYIVSSWIFCTCL